MLQVTGKYSFVAYDNLGNMAKADIEVNNIDKLAPEIELKVNTEEWTNDDVLIEWEVRDTQSGVRDIVTPDGGVNDVKIASYAVTKNGEYFIIAYDKVGNQTIKKIVINNIDKIKPTIKLTKQKLSDEQTEITWEVEDKESGIREVLLPDNQKVEGKTRGTYIVEKTGTFTFVTYDNAGNYDIQDITID